MGSSSSQPVANLYEKPESTVLNIYTTPENKAVDTLPIKDNVHQNKKDEIYLLKRMFYKLDPAVIKDSFDTAYGQIKLAIKYVSSQEMLLVKVFEVRYLSAKNVRGHVFSPYVKIELVSTNQTQTDGILMLAENGEKYTSEISNSTKLSYNEIFSFKGSLNNFEDLVLRCSVWSTDGLGHDDFFGETYLDIFELDCVDTVQIAWHNLKALTDITIGGEIDLHLGYKLPNTLIVTINTARGIKRNNQSGDARTALSVRMFIPGVPYAFRTTPVRGDDEYTWIETFSFPVPKEELVSRYLVLILTDTNEDDSYLGECHIDLENLDVTRGFEGTFQLSDMRGNNIVRSRWSKNAVTQELQEALHAHSVYMRPQFLFDPKSSRTKDLTVSVPKAFVHSQMRVVNGVVVQ
ncbi:synaptotagmin-C-like [Styela clava]